MPTSANARFLTALISSIVGLEAGEGIPDAALAIFHEAIGKRPPALRRQVGVFLNLLRWLPALRHGKPFERLSEDQHVAVLTWFQSAPVALFRKGFWGVKALVYMGYYGRPELGPEIGYRPSPGGNDLLRA
ncbi:MAG: hypothetical protein FJZ01_03805 [Candidatus Sericytochromatia bacterium]|nr:hypothetical protein [Candidatus Tanganyikabacteria bacterium]